MLSLRINHSTCNEITPLDRLLEEKFRIAEPVQKESKGACKGIGAACTGGQIFQFKNEIKKSLLAIFLLRQTEMLRTRGPWGPFGSKQKKHPLRCCAKNGVLNCFKVT
jgi:hypothetical protein